MKFAFVLAALTLTALGQPVFADAGHSHGGKVSFGSSGKESEVTRTVEVAASDAMRFTPGSFRIKLGETIKFVVKNTGKTAHEFSIGDRDAQREHAAMMKSMPEMKHEHSSSTILLEPGETKTLIWKFDQLPKSPLEIACHLPGHYEAGMKAEVGLSRR